MSSRLVLEFTTSSGDKSFSFNYADPQVTSADVKALAQAMITNGDIYETVPLTIKSAKIVTTTTTMYDLSE